MSKAKDLESTWSFMPEHIKVSQAKHLLKNAKKHIIHEVNKLKVFRWRGHFEVINEETFFIKYFDTEEESLNYCLDFYHETKISKQGNLFENNDNF